MWLIDVAKQPDSRPLHILNAVLKRSKALSPYGELWEAALTLRVSCDSWDPPDEAESWFITVFRMQAAILHATAEMRAAPRPLPSSDWMKVISQWGVISNTSLWNSPWNWMGEFGKFCILIVFISHGVISFTHLCFLLISPLISLCLPSRLVLTEGVVCRQSHRLPQWSSVPLDNGVLLLGWWRQRGRPHTCERLVLTRSHRPDAQCHSPAPTVRFPVSLGCCRSAFCPPCHWN